MNCNHKFEPFEYHGEHTPGGKMMCVKCGVFDYETDTIENHCPNKECDNDLIDYDCFELDSNEQGYYTFHCKKISDDDFNNLNKRLFSYILSNKYFTIDLHLKRWKPLSYL